MLCGGAISHPLRGCEISIERQEIRHNCGSKRLVPRIERASPEDLSEIKILRP